MWNGTALILNARPASTKTRPNSGPGEAPSRAKAAAMPVEVHRAGEAVEQRHAEEQDAAGERAEDEIFEPRFGRALVGAAEGGEDVGRRGLQLEPDVERDQAGGRDHHRAAERGEQDQHRIFGAMLGIALEPAVRGDDRDRRREEDDRLAERREEVGRDLAAEDRPGVGRRRRPERRSRRAARRPTPSW